MPSIPGLARLKPHLQPAYHRVRGLKGDLVHEGPRNPGTPADDAPDHVLLLIIDALRPDAAEAVPAETGQAIAPAPWTFPSVTSLLTGSYPHDHGCVGVIPPDESGPLVPARTDAETLPGALEAAGWATGSFVGFLMPHLAVEGLFGTHRTWHHADAERALDRYRAWRDGRDHTFGYVHLGDLHEPIEPPESYVDAHDVDTSIPDLATWNDDHTESYGGPESERYREERLKLYRAAASYVRDAVDPVLDDVADDTLVIVTADHGEAHWEQVELARSFTDSRPAHGAGHGGTPWDAVARVPLAVSDPGDRLRTPTGGGWPSLVDVPATIADRAGLDASFGDRSWSAPIPADRAVRCEGAVYGSERRAVYRSDEKLIHGPRDGVHLYGTVDREGWGESLDPVDDPPADLVAALPRPRDRRPTQDAGAMVESRLEALGYK